LEGVPNGDAAAKHVEAEFNGDIQRSVQDGAVVTNGRAGHAAHDLVVMVVRHCIFMIFFMFNCLCRIN
jgi:hypothetical protein